MDIQQGQGDNGQVPSDAEHVGDEQKDKDHNLQCGSSNSPRRINSVISVSSNSPRRINSVISV